MCNKTRKPQCDEIDSETNCERQCIICGDSASGFHYSVMSCEACKSFFKRSVQSEVTYICLAQQNCEVSRNGRKLCQFCRFEKCLTVGMSRNDVRKDRSRGGRKRCLRTTEDNFNNIVQNLAHTSNSPNDDIETKCHLKLTSSEPASQIALSKANYQLITDLLSHSSILRENRYEMYAFNHDKINKSSFSGLFQQCISLKQKRFIDWCKVLPGVCWLPKDQIQHILAVNIFGLIAWQICYESMPLEKDLICFDNNLIMSTKIIMASNVSVELFQVMQNLTANLREMNVTLEEYCTQLIINLLDDSSDICFEENVSCRISKLREDYCDLLSELCDVNRYLKLLLFNKEMIKVRLGLEEMNLAESCNKFETKLSEIQMLWDNDVVT